MNLKPKTLENLQHFVNKVCTVYIAGKDHSVLTEIRHIDIDGLWGQCPQNGTAIFIPMDSLAMIGEEVVLEPENPEHARLIAEYEKKFGKQEPLVHEPPPKPKQSEVAFVDARQLGNLARQTKMNYDNLGKVGLDAKPFP